MTRVDKILQQVREGRGVVAFRDLERLLASVGFRLARVSGSHHIYVHPRVPRPLSVQPVGKDAKPYQVRQLRDMIREFDLSPES